MRKQYLLYNMVESIFLFYEIAIYRLIFLQRKSSQKQKQKEAYENYNTEEAMKIQESYIHSVQQQP